MIHVMQNKIRILEDQLQELYQKKEGLQEELKSARTELAKLENLSSPLSTSTYSSFSLEEKIQIFKDFFRGRMDVFPKRWHQSRTDKFGYSPACFNEWKIGCNKPRIKCSDCPNQAFVPITEEVIRKHLGGEDSKEGKRDFTIGLYPMLSDDTCWFLVMDLDKDQWQQDAAAFIKTCQKNLFPMRLRNQDLEMGPTSGFFLTNPF